MAEELISVIIPAYNVEKYIGRCLESLRNQTYENFEIIIAEDGSGDNTLSVCKGFAEKDSRISVIESSENRGVSFARNCGLDHSAGAFVAFVDGDDYVDSDYLEKLYRAVKESDADAAVCSFRIVDCDGKALGEEFMPLSLKSGRDVLENVLKPGGYRLTVVWNKLYKRELFRKLRFAGRKYEDEEINYKLFWSCNKVTVVRDCLYSYVKREGSLTADQMSREDFLAQEDFQKRRMDFYLDKKDTYLYGLAIQRYCNWAIDCAGNGHACIAGADLRKLQREVRAYGWQALKHEGIQLKVKIQDILGMINIRAGAVIKGIYKKRLTED